ATRSRQAIDIASADGINDDREYNRDGAGFLQHCCDSYTGTRQDDIWGELDQFGREFAGVARPKTAPAYFNLHISAVHPAQLLESLHKRRQTSLPFHVIRSKGHEY